MRRPSTLDVHCVIVPMIPLQLTIFSLTHALRLHAPYQAPHKNAKSKPMKMPFSKTNWPHAKCVANLHGVVVLRLLLQFCTF